MITAEQARINSEKKDNEGLIKILKSIESESLNGKRIIHWYAPFSKYESKLNELGFKVRFSESIAIQKDNLYGSITW